MVFESCGGDEPWFVALMMMKDRFAWDLYQGILVGPGNELGRPVTIEEARNHIFGFVLMNDWSGVRLESMERGLVSSW